MTAWGYILIYINYGKMKSKRVIVSKISSKNDLIEDFCSHFCLKNGLNVEQGGLKHSGILLPQNLKY